jgi:hypothetical protein
MAEHLSKDEFVAHMGPIREDIKELVQLQREQNGRVNKLEHRVGVLSWAYTAGAAALSFISYKITGNQG